MPRWILPALVAAGLVTSVGAGGAAPGAATAVDVVEAPFHDPRVMIATSEPPQFDLLLDRDMPTPGWSITVDDVEVDADSGRIVARLTEVAPEGATAQVITPTTFRVPLGRLSRGTYVLELWSRRGTAGSYARAQALVLRAR